MLDKAAFATRRKQEAASQLTIGFSTAPCAR